MKLAGPVELTAGYRYERAAVVASPELSEVGIASVTTTSSVFSIGARVKLSAPRPHRWPNTQLRAGAPTVAPAPLI